MNEDKTGARSLAHTGQDVAAAERYLPAPPASQLTLPIGREDDYLPAASCYAPSASGAAEAAYLFVEGRPGHLYLYDLYGDLPGAQLLTCPHWFGDPENPDEALAFVFRSISQTTKALFFITFDQPVYYWYGAYREAFFRFLAACPVPVYGILHVMPRSSEELQAVQVLGELVDGICFLSNAMAEQARSDLKLGNSQYLPLHPATFRFPSAVRDRNAFRERLGVLPYQLVFSMIGEARNGKGISLLLESLEHIPSGPRDQMFFLFAGQATDYRAEDVRAALRANRVAGLVDLRSRPDGFHYAVLTDREFAQYVAASDVGLLLYQGEQRRRMSGVLGDLVWANCIGLATENSYVGVEVQRHQLGPVLQSEQPEVLAGALVEALQPAQQGYSKSESFSKYRREIAPQAVLQQLLSIIDPTGRSDGYDAFHIGKSRSHPDR